MYPARELVKFYSKNLRNNQAQVNTKNRGKTMSERIVELYQQEYSDDEIEELLYEGKSNNQNFRKLKSRMLEKSLDNLLSGIEKVKFRNKYDENIFAVNRLLLVSQLILLKDNRKLAEPLLKKAFRISTLVEATPMIIQCSRLLSYTYAFYGNKDVSDFYSEVLKKNLEIYGYEVELEMDYNAVLPEISEEAEYTKDTKKKIKNLYSKAKSIILKQKSRALQLLYYRISVMYFHSIHDFHSLKIHCRQAISYLESKPHLFQNARAGDYSLYEMDGCLRLKQYAQGSVCAERCLKYFVPYTSTWSVFYEYYFLLAMRTLNFKSATNIIGIINNSQYKLKKMLVRQVERWKIYEAYLYFVTGKLNDNKQIRLYKYLNEITIFNKDKKGYNYTILISKFLLLFNTGHINEMINFEDSFRLYFYKYIKAAEYPRHHLFGKFILKFYRRNFRMEKDEMDYYLTELGKHDILEETEIITYDELIKIICSRAE
jgi:hypothetical protein